VSIGQSEREVLAKRENGTIRAGKLPQDFPDEQQPIDAVSEYQAQSEREDGTNVG
jgi:hypothetical protein